MRSGEGDEGGEAAQDEYCKKRGKEKIRKKYVLFINPYPANVENMVSS